jgi:hypothetical protein
MSRGPYFLPGAALLLSFPIFAQTAGQITIHYRA